MNVFWCMEFSEKPTSGETLSFVSTFFHLSVSNCLNAQPFVLEEALSWVRLKWKSSLRAQRVSQPHGNSLYGFSIFKGRNTFMHNKRKRKGVDTDFATVLFAAVFVYIWCFSMRLLNVIGCAVHGAEYLYIHCDKNIFSTTDRNGQTCLRTFCSKEVNALFLLRVLI